MVDKPRPWIVNKPVTIRGWTGHYLCNRHDDDPCFFTTNRLIGEHWMILPSGPTYIIKSYVDGRNLETGADGFILMCNDEASDAQWKIMRDASSPNVFYLMSCRTEKNLQCNNDNMGFTANTNMLKAEAMLIEPVVPDTSRCDIERRQ